MKRFLSVFLFLCILFSVSASLADKHLYAHYSLFIDGEFYNTFYKAGFEFDTQLYDLYLYSDFSGVLFSKEEWYKGQRINYGLEYATYKNTSDGFTLIFDDYSVIDGYFDKDTEDIWLNLGGAYLRLCPVHSFNIQKDMVSK